MTIESKEKALPGYKSLAEVQNKQVKLLWKMLEENRIGNDFLHDLIDLHTEQNDN